MIHYGKRLQAISRLQLMILPETQPGQPGRANKLAAEAYLAKVRLYQAYTQDDHYNVIGIDQAKAAGCYYFNG